jgi:thioredoxin 1
MSNAVVQLSGEGFDEAIKAGVVLVDFWAPWCGPCKMQLPILDSVAEKAEGATVAKVNVDENADLAAKYGVRSIPTLIVFKDGEVHEQLNGMQQEAALLEALKSAQ